MSGKLIIDITTVILPAFVLWGVHKRVEEEKYNKYLHKYQCRKENLIIKDIDDMCRQRLGNMKRARFTVRFWFSWLYSELWCKYLGESLDEITNIGFRKGIPLWVFACILFFLNGTWFTIPNVLGDTSFWILLGGVLPMSLAIFASILAYYKLGFESETLIEKLPEEFEERRLDEYKESEEEYNLFPTHP